MSSGEEDYKTDRNGARIKRRGRACDLCRHKKVRCDGQPGERCSNCNAAQSECTYLKEAKKRYPDAERIRALETELANYKKLLNKLHPGVDFSRELSGILNENSLWLLDGKAGSSSSQSPLRLPTPPTVASPAAPLQVDLDSSDDEISAHQELRRSMSALTLHSEFPRYLGKSSRIMFFKQAFDMRNSYAGVEPPGGGTLFNERLKMSLSRNKYLRSQAWVMRSLEPVSVVDFNFPPDDLMSELVHFYFDRVNQIIPLLHRPTFNSCIAGGLHHEDDGFASLLLLVCACGSRFSKDRRVLAEGSDNWHSAGWRWFIQVQSKRKAINLRPPRLYDIQIPTLVHLYLHGSCISHPSWPQIGLGMRLAQDMGAHRRKTYGGKHTVEGELMRRAFWALIMVDRGLSFSLGRPCSIEDEDIDVEFPTECDDEYWTHPDPEKAWKQPEGKPSVIAFFNAALKLKQIHAFAIRTLYSTKKSRVQQGSTGPEWEQHIVSEMDSALNQWIDSVPDHLRWDPHKEPNLWLRQSAFLYSSYYSTQINIHRAFIPSPRKPSTLSFPSLAICTNAARSCIHVLDVQFRRGVGEYTNTAALFSSAIVLLLNIWGGKNGGTSVNAAKDLAEVHKAMEILKGLERQWYIGGRYWEVLCDLANVGDLPLPQPGLGQKRARGEEGVTAPSPATPEDPSLTNGSRHIAGSRRVSAAYANSTPSDSPNPNDTPASVYSPSMDFVLPIHSDELGRIPIFPPQSMPPHQPPQPPPPTTAPAAGTWSQFDMTPSMFGSASPDVGGASVPALGAMSAPAAPFAATVPQPVAEPPPAPFHTNAFPTFSPMPPPMDQVHTGLEQSDAAFTLPFTRNGDGGAVGGDTLSMWSTAPEGFEWDEWGVFINSMNSPQHNGA